MGPGMVAIPFNVPTTTGTELRYLEEAIRLGALTADGPFTKKCSQLLTEKYGLRYPLLTPSCTAALEMAADLCRIQPGDEVLMPSYTFVSTANAFVRMGAIPKFIDITADTLNLDWRLIEKLVTAKTKVVVPVHYAGVSCNMTEILRLASQYNLLVVEDAAQAFGAKYRGQALGSIGDLGTYSFHSTKNLNCGEGGALIVNSKSFLDRSFVIRDKGTNRQKFLAGTAKKYTWVDSGSSYVPSELCSAFLLAQLEVADEILARRQERYLFYYRALLPLTNQGLVRLPSIPSDCESNHHIFHLILETPEVRTELLTHLRKGGIQATFHYVPLHDSPMGHKLGYRLGDLPITEQMSARIIRLPLFHAITIAQQERVLDRVLSFFKKPLCRLKSSKMRHSLTEARDFPSLLRR